jgi:hypothetical protein
MLKSSPISASSSVVRCTLVPHRYFKRLKGWSFHLADRITWSGSGHTTMTYYRENGDEEMSQLHNCKLN